MSKSTPRIVLATADLRVVEVTYGMIIVERRGFDAMKAETWTEDRRISHDGVGDTSDNVIYSLLLYGQRPTGVAPPVLVNTGDTEPLPSRSPPTDVGTQKECPGNCTWGGNGPPCGPRCKG